MVYASAAPDCLQREMGQVGAHLCSVCSLIVREWRRNDVEVTSMACVPVELRSQIGTLDHCIDVSTKFPVTRTSPFCFATIYGNDGLVARYMSRASEPRHADTEHFSCYVQWQGDRAYPALLAACLGLLKVSGTKWGEGLLWRRVAPDLRPGTESSYQSFTLYKMACRFPRVHRSVSHH